MKDIRDLLYVFRTQLKRKNLRGRHHTSNPWF
jgi:hypothetical protein